MANGTKGLMAPSESHDVNFYNLQKNAIIIYMIYCVCAVGLLVLFFIPALFLRGGSRERRSQNYMILPPCILTTVAQLIIFIAVLFFDHNVHAWEKSLDTATRATTLVFTANLFLISGTALARLVICITYSSLLTPFKWARYVIRFTGGLVVTASTAAWLALLFACKPIDAAWDLRLSGEAQCIDRYPFHILQAGSGAVADVIVMAVMLYHCLSPRHSWKDKSVLLTHFSSGLLLPIPAVARLAILATAREDPDTTFALAPAILCFIIEANLVIMYNLIPDFKRFVRMSGNPSSPVNGTMDGRQGGMLQGSNSILGGDGRSTDSVGGYSLSEESAVELVTRNP
ncbi:hypothetical protein FPOA_11999 [Fusarium poae]|uniref:Rhodopsin domain-containing protein n=1 Tax=Fusarium poae TaxID=36050 RepID=A0A1B8AAP7_FUSPO|nr:hypothetical protein FPOA_13119 [Fusarium poae]OBS17077.1 hypothetical protein FPOA_12357 [Fusarium poae]OBS17551.1 hypothetical protein FPOA_11999 [Fusarium poae]